MPTRPPFRILTRILLAALCAAAPGTEAAAGPVRAPAARAPLAARALAAARAARPALSAARATVLPAALLPAAAAPGLPARREAPSARAELAQARAFARAAARPAAGRGEARRASAAAFDALKAAPGAPVALAASGPGFRGSGLTPSWSGPTKAPVLVLDKPLFPNVPINIPTTRADLAPMVELAKASGGYMLAVTRGQQTSEGHNRTATLHKIVQQSPGRDGSVVVTIQGSRVVELTSYERAPSNNYLLANFTYPEQIASDSGRMGQLATAVKALLPELARRGDISPQNLNWGLRAEAAALGNFLAQEMPWISDKARMELLSSPSDELRLRQVLAETAASLHPGGRRAAAPDEDEEADRRAPEAASSGGEAAPPRGGEGAPSDGLPGNLDTEKGFLARLDAIGMPPKARAVALREFRQMLAAGRGQEGDKLRAYLQWLTGVPWAKRTQDNLDLARARKILDDSHFGMEKVKERVLEFLAVRKRSGRGKGAILLFVGPPGVGKTSIARAIAESMGRQFVRLSLGGVYDESKLRGHGRTYLGSQPGGLIRQMRSAGTVNPVFLLDEVDKMASGRGHGDPSAALLEVLDPEQNSTFADTYLEVDYDLSDVLFVVTANDLSAIPAPLRDRMEIIEFSAYTPQEKAGIAARHLIPRLRAENGLAEPEASLTPAAVARVIDGYTLEAGVRALKNVLNALLRRASAWIETRGARAPGLIDAADVEKYLGPREYEIREITDNGVGIGTGLGVSDLGGSVMNLVASLRPGGSGQVRGRAQQLEMIKDSAENALVFVQSRARELGFDAAALAGQDLDLAFTPAGKIDGPSAGMLLATVMASRLSGRAVRPGIAMTGEITPDGRVLKIGGLREKVIAAHRAGMRVVYYPAANESDVADIPEEIRREMTLKPVRRYLEAFPEFLEPAPSGAAAAR